MGWYLGSVDGTVTLAIDQIGNGPLSGQMTVNGQQFKVKGGWQAGGSNNNAASVFFVSASNTPNGALHVSGVGELLGNWITEWPSAVPFAGGYCSSLGMKGGDSSHRFFSGFDKTLLPMIQSSTGWVKIGMDSAGCVVVIGRVDPNDEHSKVDCVYLSVNGQPRDPSGVFVPGEPSVINLPVDRDPTKPADIFFLDDMEHFLNPPLMEPHYQIRGILYDAKGQNPTGLPGLMLEYLGTNDTQTINFNEGPDIMLIHGGVVIKPQ